MTQLKTCSWCGSILCSATEWSATAGAIVVYYCLNTLCRSNRK